MELKETQSDSVEVSGQKSHTPGPWEALKHPGLSFDEAVRPEICPWIIDEVEGYRIAYVLGDCLDLNSEANARLIAAAPELLEACEDALFASVDETTYPDGPCLPKEVRDLLRAAIAKAEGRSSVPDGNAAPPHTGAS